MATGTDEDVRYDVAYYVFYKGDAAQKKLAVDVIYKSVVSSSFGNKSESSKFLELCLQYTHDADQGLDLMQLPKSIWIQNGLAMMKLRILSPRKS